jgi:hypothetical protein
MKSCVYLDITVKLRLTVRGLDRKMTDTGTDGLQKRCWKITPYVTRLTFFVIQSDQKSLCTWWLQYRSQVHRDFLITLYYVLQSMCWHTNIRRIVQNAKKKNNVPLHTAHNVIRNAVVFLLRLPTQRLVTMTVYRNWQILGRRTIEILHHVKNYVRGSAIRVLWKHHSINFPQKESLSILRLTISLQRHS